MFPGTEANWHGMACVYACELLWLLSIKPHPAQEIPHAGYRRQDSTLAVFGVLAI